MTPLYGRPAPSSLLPMSFADGRETAVPPTGLEYGFPSHVLRTDPTATPGEGSGWQAPTALHHADPSSLYCLPPSVSAPSHWRTAHSILAAQDKGDQHLNEGKEQYTSATMQIGGPLDEASRAAQSYQAQESPALSPPPRYRRGPFPGEQSNQFNPRAARAQPRAPRNQQHEGGRFPRWRGWLEKRAQERNGIDKGAENPEGKKTGGAPSDVRRKKSWGAAVDDDDAVSETGETVIVSAVASGIGPKSERGKTQVTNCLCHICPCRPMILRRHQECCTCTTLAVVSYHMCPHCRFVRSRSNCLLSTAVLLPVFCNERSQSRVSVGFL